MAPAWVAELHCGPGGGARLAKDVVEGQAPTSSLDSALLLPHMMLVSSRYAEVGREKEISPRGLQRRMTFP